MAHELHASSRSIPSPPLKHNNPSFATSASSLEQVLEHKRRNNLRKMAPPPSHQELQEQEPPVWLQHHRQRRQQREQRRREKELKQQQQQQQQQQQHDSRNQPQQNDPHNQQQQQKQSDPHNQPSALANEACTVPKPKPLCPRQQQQQQQPQVSPFCEASLHPLPQARVRIQTPEATPIGTPTSDSTPASVVNALHTTGSFNSRKETSADDTTTLSGKSSPPRLPDPEIPHSVSAPHPVFLNKQQTPYSSTDHLDTLGETVSGPNVVVEGGSSRRGRNACAEHGLQPSTRWEVLPSQPLAYVEERETPLGVSVHSTATSPTAAVTQRRTKRGGLAQ
eukprot:scaffold3876_cov22-Tisochrysis_lutea.AAC.1